ncbi:MAG: hypothetical protein OEV43_05995, partial [Coriobacteriia bacterium]|nr:hypothetical protein [Coriobacteriia bacterium]
MSSRRSVALRLQGRTFPASPSRVYRSRAASWIETVMREIKTEPVPIKVWGDDIDDKSLEQARHL